jgi:hypothetical protein
LTILKELYLADNVLLTGIIPVLPGLIVLDVSGTNLDSGLEGSATIPESMPTDSETLLKLDGSKTAQHINLIIIVLSSVGALLFLAVAIGLTIFLARRAARDKTQREKQDLLNEARNKLKQQRKH